MTQRFTMFAFIAAASLFAAPAAAQNTTEQTLLRLENEWSRALVKNDTAFFRRILAPTFIYTEDSVVMTKDELIKAITGSGDTVTSSTSENMKVYLHGNTAIVIGVLVVKGQGGGKPFIRRFRFTDTWQNRNGEWIVIAAQDYLIPG